MPSNINFTKVESAAYISIDRPASRNALLPDDVVEFTRLVNEAGSDPQVRVIVLGGEGNFCSGVDVGVFESIGSGRRWPQLGDFIFEVFEPLVHALSNAKKPSIALLDGIVAGAGLSMALNCDYRLATKKAKFIPAFSKLGLIPDCGGSWLLPRLLGHAKAMEFASIGTPADAEKAKELGLVTWLVDSIDHIEIEERIAIVSALSTSGTTHLRRLLSESWSSSLSEALAAERTAMSELGAGSDFREGLLAFQQRRSPEFEG
ncbi:MAG: enoyl-CoA hydratase/isomerase family protein [Nitrososphaera sp.]